MKFNKKYVMSGLLIVFTIGNFSNIFCSDNDTYDENFKIVVLQRKKRNKHLQHPRKDYSLAQAIGNNDVDFLKGRLNEGINPNQQDENGLSLLHDASFQNKPEIVSLLLDLGANPNIIDNAGDTPLHMAALNNSVGAANILNNYGADRSLQDNDGKIALDYAQSSEMKELVSL